MNEENEEQIDDFFAGSVYQLVAELDCLLCSLFYQCRHGARVEN